MKTFLIDNDYDCFYDYEDGIFEVTREQYNNFYRGKNKIVYPSIPALLEKNCPAIFEKYVKLLKGNSENPLVQKRQTNVAVLPQMYLDTDIYKASREIKKMQKLHSNILSSWYEDTLYKRPQIERT